MITPERPDPTLIHRLARLQEVVKRGVSIGMEYWLHQAACGPDLPQETLQWHIWDGTENHYAATLDAAITKAERANGIGAEIKGADCTPEPAR